MSLYFRVIESDSNPRMHDVQVLLNMRRKEHEGQLKMKAGRELAWIQPGYFYIIAYSHDGPVGFVHVQEGANHNGKVLNMHEFYTLPAMRHQSVAKKLMIYLGKVADQRGIQRLSIPNYTHRMKNVIEWALQNERIYRRMGGNYTFSEGVAKAIDKNAIHIFRNKRTRRLPTRIV